MASRSSISTLHARINLPSSFPTSTLQRCLMDHTASRTSNNAGLASHGTSLLGYYVSNHIVTRYPRLPYKATTNALISYIGYKTLANIGREWGVTGSPREPLKVETRTRTPKQAGRAPTADELDAMLQFQRVAPGQLKSADEPQTYVDNAYADFVRSVVGGMAIHASTKEVREFIQQHILSRDINLAKSFSLTQPQRELSFLCQREGLEKPVTRIIAESGRRTNAPVFVIGVYSGTQKLGEGQASSIREAEFQAQSNAMKAWYLFEDKMPILSSRALEVDGDFKSPAQAMIDVGDVIV